MPALLGMPLLLAAYGELKTQRFGLALTSYPRAYLLEDIADFTAVLQQDAEQFDSKSVSDWIAANSGPLPAGEMPMRIARIRNRSSVNVRQSRCEAVVYALPDPYPADAIHYRFGILEADRMNAFRLDPTR